MKRVLIVLLVIVLLIIGYGIGSYYSGRANAAPPYTCQGLNLVSAKKSADDNQRYYNFVGTCQIKIPQGNSWVYQQVCAKIAAAWDRSSNTAIETTEIASKGSVNLQLQCQDDPWVSDARCTVIKSSNTTPYPAFTKQFVFYNREFPPLARDAALANPQNVTEESSCAPAATHATSPKGVYPVPHHYARNKPEVVVYVIRETPVVWWWRPCPFWNPWCNAGPTPVCPPWNPWCNPWVPPTVCPWWNPNCNPWYPPNPCPWWNPNCNPWVPQNVCPWWNPNCNPWLVRHACPPWNPNCSGPILPMRCGFGNMNCRIHPGPILPLAPKRPIEPLHPIINPLHPTHGLLPINPIKPEPLKPIPIIKPIPEPKPFIHPVRPPYVHPIRPPYVHPVRPPYVHPVQPIHPLPEPLHPVRPPYVHPIRPPYVHPIRPPEPTPVRPITPPRPPVQPVHPPIAPPPPKRIEPSKPVAASTQKPGNLKEIEPQ